MKVREIIEQLQAFHPDTEVWFWHGTDAYYGEVDRVAPLDYSDSEGWFYSPHEDTEVPPWESVCTADDCERVAGIILKDY